MGGDKLMPIVAGDDGTGDPVAPALLGVLPAKYSAIVARD
jgi:hypothetical protein